jgi:hypothetical protein
VGIERAAYLPALTAGALASYERIVIPLPPAGWVPGNFAEVVPQLGVSYLLLDFGGRRAMVEAARQRSFAANVTFTAAHQCATLPETPRKRPNAFAKTRHARRVANHMRAAGYCRLRHAVMG